MNDKKAFALILIVAFAAVSGTVLFFNLTDNEEPVNQTANVTNNTANEYVQIDEVQSSDSSSRSGDEYKTYNINGKEYQAPNLMAADDMAYKDEQANR